MRAKKNNATLANVNHSTSTQTSIKVSLYSMSGYSCSSQRLTEISNAIPFHLGKDLCPLKTVNNADNFHDKGYGFPLISCFFKVAKPSLYAKRCMGNGEGSHTSPVICYMFKSRPSCRCNEWSEKCYILCF